MKREVPPEQAIRPSKADRPLTEADNLVTVIFQDGERLELKAATLPRVVEAGLLFVIDENGAGHHIPIANNIKRFFWRMRKG